MSTTISYENPFSNPIPHQQITNLDSYYRVYRINGNRKKKEFYNSGNLELVLYYMDPIESEATILGNLHSEYPTSEISLIYLEMNPVYSVKIEKFYNNESNYVGKTKTILNANDQEICYVDFNKNGTIEEIKKILYVDNDSVLYFTYDINNNNLISMSGNVSPFVAESQYISADQIDFFFPNLLIENPYYKDGTLLP